MSESRTVRMEAVRNRQLSEADFPVEIMREFRQSELGLHGHGFSELVVILKGQGMHVLEEEQYPVTSGDVFVLSGDRAHGYRDTRNLHLTNILFLPDRLPMAMSDLESLPGYHALFTLEPHYRKRHHFRSRLHLSFNDLTRVCVWVDELHEELQTQNAGYRFMATALFMRIIGFLCRRYAQLEEAPVRTLLRLGEAMSYLENNYRQPITLDELAGVAHMSKSSLQRAFRQAVGVSPIDHLLRLRVRKASELLSFEGLSITEIAFQVGFQDSNYFSRCFRRVTGLSPREMRRRAKA